MRDQGNTPTIIAATNTKAAQNTRALIERVKPIWMPPEQVVSSVLNAAVAADKVRKQAPDTKRKSHFADHLCAQFHLTPTGNMMFCLVKPLIPCGIAKEKPESKLTVF